MTADEAKHHQDKLIAEGFSLSMWYGTNCRKCCGVYPKLVTHLGAEDLCRYECEVCGKRTDAYAMPWIAEKAWNAGHFVTGQMRLF